MPGIKLYGENHAEDNLLPAYLAIFEEARAAGCELCFVEHTPKIQKDCDAKVTFFSRFGIEPRMMLPALEAQYAGGDFNERVALQHMFLMVLSAKTGIKLVCADKAERPITRMSILRTALLEYGDQVTDPEILMISLRFSPEKVMEIENCSQKKAEQLLGRIRQEIEDGTFIEITYRAMQKRFAGDHKTVEFIEKHRKNAPAITIGGRMHIDPERPDSMVHVFREMGVNVSAFQISKGQILPLRPRQTSPARRYSMGPKT